MAGPYQGELQKLDDYRWLLPRDESLGMRTDGIVYADEALMADLRTDAALGQVANVACLPGIVGRSMAMPDCHYGYGFPIGGVAAFDVDTGIISPGGVGYDINCGVRLVRSDLEIAEVQGRLKDIAAAIHNLIPTGAGEKGAVRLSDHEVAEVLAKGPAWAVKRGYGVPEDVEHTEDRGCLPGADVGALSQRAYQRGAPQLGTLGGGNHFLEIQVVDAIYDDKLAAAFGITAPDQVCLMIHCGSRGLGHQVCEDALDEMAQAARRYGISLPDRQLACAPVNSPEGQRYLSAMAAAANYAWANRQVIMHFVREAMESVLGQGWQKLGLHLVWDVAHNVAKIEEHRVGGVSKRLCVHRKGATRSFPPGRPELPAAYRETGQPVLVPGDMGSASYLLVGTQQALEETFGSTCHGAGRVLSRTAAIKKHPSQAVRKALEAQGIVVRATGRDTLAEEAPDAYKDIDRVVEVCHGAGLSSKVARLRPVAVIKG
ncbi:MAG: RtcB family protein [Armatimonadetes bacterium]|nr:RtcB family protein [Armatimonadota bacterium]